MNSPEQPQILWNHQLIPNVVKLKKDVETAASSSGYELRIKEKTLEPGTLVYGLCRFYNSKTIEIYIWPNLNEELFNLTLAHELIHALQNVNHYPKVREKPLGQDPTAEKLAGHLTTTVLDILVNREMRDRGISTKEHGLQIFQNDLENMFKRNLRSMDGLDDSSMLFNALTYMRMYYDYYDDPEISNDIWSYAQDFWIKQAPRTGALGDQLIQIIQEEGLIGTEDCIRVYRRFLAPYDFNSSYQILGGYESSPAYRFDLVPESKQMNLNDN